MVTVWVRRCSPSRDSRLPYSRDLTRMVTGVLQAIGLYSIRPGRGTPVLISFRCARVPATPLMWVRRHFQLARVLPSRPTAVTLQGAGWVSTRRLATLLLIRPLDTF